MVEKSQQANPVDASYSLAPKYDLELPLDHQGYDAEHIEALQPTWLHGVRHNFEAAYPDVMAQSDLWPHQRDAVDAFRAILDVKTDDADPTIAVTLAHSMGLGKTVTEATLVKLCGVGKEYNERRLRAVVTAPESHMLDNFIGQQDPEKPRGLALAAPELSASKWTNRDHDTSGDVIAITLQSLVAEADKQLSGEGSDFPFDEVGMLVVEEGDAVLHGRTRAFIETFQQGRITVCGTGTPEQADGTSVLGLYPQSIGNIGFRESIETHNVTKGRPVHFYTLSPGGSFRVDGLSASGEIRDEDMEKILSHENVQSFAVELATSFAEAGLQTVMYTHAGAKSATARKLADTLSALSIHQGEPSERPIIAKAIAGHLSGNAQTIAAFSKREIDILLSSRMGEAGLDSPHLNVVVCLAPTGSERRALQRIGRLVHNSEGGVLMAIFVAYDVEDWHTKARPAQLTPIQLFDISRDHGKIHPKAPGGDRSRHGDTSQGIFNYALPAEVKDIITAQRKKYPFVLRDEMLLSSREAAARPGEYVLDDIANMANVDSDYLKRILHAEGQYVSTRMVNGESVSYCDEAGLLHMDEVMATNGQYSRQDIAEHLGSELSWVRDLMSRSYKHAAYTERYDRVLRSSSVRKQRQYDIDTVRSVAAAYAKRPLPKKQPPVAPPRPPEVPQDGTYIPGSKLRDRLRHQTNLSTQELIQRLPDSFTVKEFYAHNRTASFVLATQLESAATYLRYVLADTRPEKTQSDLTSAYDTVGIHKLLRREPEDTSDISLKDITRITGHSTQNVSDIMEARGAAVTGSKTSDTVQYDAAILWLRKRLNAPVFGEADKLLYMRINTHIIQDFVPAGHKATYVDLQAILAQASVPTHTFRTRHIGARIDSTYEYIKREDRERLLDAARSYFYTDTAVTQGTEAAPVEDAESLAQAFRLTPNAAQMICEFVFGRNQPASKHYIRAHKLISAVIAEKSITIPPAGFLSAAATRTIFAHIVMQAEPFIAKAVQNDTHVRMGRSQEASKVASMNAERTRNGQSPVNDTATMIAIQHIEQAPITEWATLEDMASRLTISLAEMKRVLVECRPQQTEIVQRGEGTAMKYTLQMRCRTYVSNLKKRR